LDPAGYGPPSQELRLGLGANWRQFGLLVVINAFVGGLVGLERAVLPVLAEAEFGLASHTVSMAFIVTFGLAKAAANLAAGTLADRVGRKGVLVAGWLLGLPVPLLIITASGWEWVVLANVLLGINQGFCWSLTVIMKIDLVGPARRGLAMGLNEAAGYGAVAGAAYAAAALAEALGLRPYPFLLGLGFALVGLGLSTLLVRETRPFARYEATLNSAVGVPAQKRGSGWVFLETSFRDRALSAASQAGLVNNLNDGMAWGLLPLVFTRAGLDLGTVGLLAALYPAIWGLGQLPTGALSDRLGRKGPIVAGMWLQAGAIWAVPWGPNTAMWATAMVLLGLGTALVYPTLLAAVSDVAHPDWRASAVGVYRLWRDTGYALGALLAGVTADLLGVQAAILAVGILTFVSGLVVLLRMYETLPARRSG